MLNGITKLTLVYFTALCSIPYLSKAQQSKVFPGADETTSSRSQYFSWINNTNEGSTEKQTLINLEFFSWLHSEYGMALDIYAFDAGNIDGKGYCGSIVSERFKQQFPNSFNNIYKAAKAIDTRLGVWGGPDCFGNTVQEEKARLEMMVELCKKYHFALFKFDAVNGNLRTEKQDAFIEMMQQCRKYSPDLILLNHRLELGKGLPYATTFLFEGAETYIDVHMPNTATATHHRQGALSRGLVPGLQRLTEDHGVCISSCLDFWDDDLILQAFNRNLILAPQIYGNPWLLRDDEYATLARIFNLHRRYGKILVKGKILPEDKYGEKALSRGDGVTQFITFRNLEWTPKKITLKLDEEIGLTTGASFEVRQFHPTEKIIGRFKKGSSVVVEVAPFRSYLIAVSADEIDELGIKGCDYKVITDIAGKPAKIQLLGLPGTKINVQLSPSKRRFTTATLDGKSINALIKGNKIEVDFPGTPLKHAWHRKLSTPALTSIPEDAETLYEATCFAADNNALEVRSLERSGATKIPEVQAARDAFFKQAVFIERNIWDKNLFDGDSTTGFDVNHSWGQTANGIFRLDLGEILTLDELILTTGREGDIHPLKTDEGAWVDISTDLKTWKTLRFLTGRKMSVKLKGEHVRYLRFRNNFEHLLEVEGHLNGQPVERKKWHASNLFQSWKVFAADKAWKSTFRLPEITEGSYLCIALNGKHGVEGAYAALKINGEYVGTPDRSVSFPSNVWEYPLAKADANYTYYIPLKTYMKAQQMEVIILGMKGQPAEFKPEVWVTTHNPPYVSKELVLQ
ncbi:MAG: hypothetical protein ABIP28_10745 [Mucilaginibacter sp.]